MTETFGIVVFSSTREALRAETESKEAGFTVRIIPTPPSIDATCGFALKYELHEEMLLQALLADHRCTYEGIYHATRIGLRATYERVELPT